MLNGNSAMGDSAGSVAAAISDPRPGDPQPWRPLRVVW